MMAIKALLTAVILLFSGLGIACQEWQASTKNNQVSGWDYQLNPQNVMVTPDPKDSSAKVIKFTITPDSIWPNGHTRAELKHNGCATNEGDTSYFSWEFYLDRPIKITNNIAYWETDKTYQQSMGFYLKPEVKSGHPITELTFFSSHPKRQIHWQTIVEVDKWHKIDMALTWSENKQDGRISLWFNNQAVITKLTAKTKPDANQLFVQLGLHRNQSDTLVDTIYLRNVKETRSLAQLLTVK
ncbi:heparin lyase I family protein [Paraglaciecola marina]|uniref:heparin lyase I family protein n=1 Tax=Paraglaciecola marina TaxID=2500157 RepID=UPI00105CAC22|nr:heparin lyase I family protein [Paraglaciecola marina]